MLLSDNLYQWRAAGMALETSPGQFEYLDEAMMGRAARYYALRPIEARRELEN